MVVADMGASAIAGAQQERVRTYGCSGPRTRASGPAGLRASVRTSPLDYLSFHCQCGPKCTLLGLLLGGATAVALGGMLAWRTYLVLMAQGTIEFYSNRLSAWEARKRGVTWVNIYDGGFV